MRIASSAQACQTFVAQFCRRAWFPSNVSVAIARATWERVAEDRKIDCEQVQLENGKKRWVCTRTARPCKNVLAGGVPGLGGDKPSFDRILRRGDNGDDVKKLQELLNDLGYELTVDGDYGRGTKSAVRDFQEKNGLSADGNFGPKTAEVLLSKV